MTARRLLVARLDNCGDVLLTGPTVRALAAQQDRPIVFLCGPRGRPAAEILPGVDQVIEHRAPWIEPDPIPVRRSDSDHLVEVVRRLGVDEAVVLGSSHQSPLPLALVLRWAGVDRIGAVSHEHAGSLLDVRVKGDPDLHEVERSLAVLTALGYDRPDDERLLVDLHDGPEPASHNGEGNGNGSAPAAGPHPRRPGRNGAARAGADGGRSSLSRPRLGGLPDGGYVVVHPGATVPARTLAPAVWGAVVERLAVDGWPVLVTGSRQERGLTAGVAGHHRGVFDVGGRTTFRGLGRMIRNAAAFVGGNTGPLHLAAAVGTPTVAVFPPTVPLDRWRPWRVAHVVLGDQGVPCAGCRSRRCPLPEQVCLADVGPDQVAAAVEALTTGAPAVTVDRDAVTGHGVAPMHRPSDGRQVVRP